MGNQNKYLRDLQANWHAFGATDPLWAALTEPDARDNRWVVEEFFENGRVEIEEALARAAAIPFSFRQQERAMDFGCGPGRLVQALAEHFESCDGVDIAPSMIKVARQYNTHGDRCRFHLNEVENLSLFPDDYFDLVYSRLVLQHIQPATSRKYIQEFLRLLRPGGLIIFQIPAEPLEFRLDPAGFAAEITPQETALTVLKNEPLTVRVTVKNKSGITWPAHSLIRLYSNWLTESGEVVSRRPERAGLPSDVKGGQSAELSLTIPSPPLAGNYLLELDMLQESVACFRDHGSKPARLPVFVQGQGDQRLPAFARLNLLRALRIWAFLRTRLSRSPVMETHGVPQAEIVTLVQQAGGRVLAIDEDAAVPLWTSFRYYLTR